MFNNRPADVVQHLVLAVQTLIYMPKDYVIVKGEFGSEMFFIQSGKCDVIIEMPRAKKKDDDFVKIESSFQSINSMDSMMKVGKELFNRKQSQMVRMRAPTEKSGGSEESESGLEFEIVEKVVKELEKGDFFGEIALVTHGRRTASIRARTFTELIVLSRDDFMRITENNRDEREAMKEQVSP